MATSVFLGTLEAVEVDAAGALDGSGTLADPLAVVVDGSTITINGSNQLEAAGGAVEQTTSSTGTLDDFALSAGGTVILRCTGAAPVFTGFADLSAGRQVQLFCLGTTLTVANLDSGSSAGNQVICPSDNGLIVGAGGIIQIVADATTGKWRATTINAGAPIAVAFNAGDFSSDSGTWVVAEADVATFTYSQFNDQVTLTVSVVESTVTGTPFYLQIAVPNGFIPATTSFQPSGSSRDNGTGIFAVLEVDAADPTIYAYHVDNTTTWSSATDTTYLTGVLTIPVQ